MTSINLADRGVDLGEWAKSTPNAADEFAAAVRSWLEENLTGEFAGLKGRGGPGSEHEFFAERLEWDRHLARAGWTCIGWPTEYGGRGATLEQRIIFHREYARANAPARVNHLGEELLGPTLIAYGTEEQKRFLPGIVDVSELWSQGYSEPGAGSDLAGVSTSARLENGKWIINGQKSGRRWPTSRSGCSCSRAPRRARRGTPACRSCWCPSANPGSPSGRSNSSPAPRNSTRSSSTTRRPTPT